MRLKIRLELNAAKSGREIPINYQYELSAIIYKIISKADEKYAQMLHDEGYVSTCKRFKLFTYSNLIVPNFENDTNMLLIEPFWN